MNGRTPRRHRAPLVALAGALLVTFAIAPLAPPSAAAPDEKLTPESLVAKHLESIGTAKARSSVSTRVALGTARVTIYVPTKGENTGAAVLFSQGDKCAFGMTFKNPEYPRDNVGFDGSRVSVSQLKAGVRSTLGDFLYRRDFLFREGLLGGALSTSWTLLDPAAHGAKLEYAGTKKVEGRELHELRYVPRHGADMSVSLFFEPDTFRHVRTEYTRVSAGQMGDRSYTNIHERESRYKLVEHFSDFKPEGELTLPHTYKIELIIDTNDAAFQGEWLITLTRFAFNQEIAPDSFRVNAG